jgi:cytochrome c5
MKMTVVHVARRFPLRPTSHLLTCVVLLCGILAAQVQPPPSVKTKQQSVKNAPAPSVSPTAQDPGEHKFQTNCSRCHTAPEQLSPGIAGTVVRHMRVRASLSAVDERDILRYLAP